MPFFSPPGTLPILPLKSALAALYTDTASGLAFTIRVQSQRFTDSRGRGGSLLGGTSSKKWNLSRDVEKRESWMKLLSDCYDKKKKDNRMHPYTREKNKYWGISVSSTKIWTFCNTLWYWNWNASDSGFGFIVILMSFLIFVILCVCV